MESVVASDVGALISGLVRCKEVTLQNGFYCFEGTSIRAPFAEKPDPRRVALSVALRYGPRGIPLALSANLPSGYVRPLLKLPAVLVNALRIGRRDLQGVVGAFIYDWTRGGCPQRVIDALKAATETTWRYRPPACLSNASV